MCSSDLSEILTVYRTNSKSFEKLSLKPLSLNDVLCVSPGNRYALTWARSSRRNLLAILDLAELKMAALDPKDIGKIESLVWEGDSKLFIRGDNEMLLTATLKGLSWVALKE